MFLRFCLLATFLVSVPFSGQAQYSPEEIKEYMSQWRADRRGPYQDIRWFCPDGSTRAARDPCPEEEGWQRARYRPEVIELGRRNHLFLGQILATTNRSDFWDAGEDNARLKQYQIEQFLRNSDNGWILEKAQFYRGAFQVEDEMEWGKEFLEWLLRRDDAVTEHYFLVRQAVRDVPHARDNQLSQRVRAVSKTIAEDYPKFMDIRVKIHGQPSREDVAATQAFQREHADKLNPQLTEQFATLIEDMEEMYQIDLHAEIRDRLQDVPGDHPLHAGVSDFVRTYPKGSSALRQIEGASDLMRDIRDGLATVNGGRGRLALMDISHILEQLIYQEAPTLQLPDARTLMDQVCYMSQASAAAGFLENWEWYQYQNDQWDVPATGAMPLGNILYFAEQSRRLVEWGTNMVRAAYGSEVERFQTFEPLAYGFLDDRIRSSVLLPLGQAVEQLSNFASTEAKLTNDVSRLKNPSTMRGLNAGFARGELVVVSGSPDEIEVENNKIYIFDRPPADLKPVAGIATVSEGNMVSHVQLLARNLGIPNAVLSAENLDDLRKWVGQEVFYAVSTRGTVVMRLAKDMDKMEKELFAEQERNEERLSVPTDKMDLTRRTVVNMNELDAASSGKWCGPKAANLGQLKQMFPDKVVEGIVIPFGIFRAHMDQPMPGQSGSYWDYLQSSFARAAQMREEGNAESAVETYTLQQLTVLREAMQTIDLLPEFRTDLQNAFTSIFGQPMGKVPVFLRSDTNMEDLPNFTGAGLNLTLFNVLDADKIWNGIKSVWASPYTERSFKWRQRLLDNPENVFPSILIIPSVNCDYSGVVITKGISTNHPDDITAAFSRGVGGAVDGQRAETHILYHTGHVQLLTPAREMSYLRIPPSGGTTRLITDFSEPILNHRNIVDLYALAEEVERTFPEAEDAEAIPYDIELGFEDDKLWLFQVRPFVENKRAAGSDYLRNINPRFDIDRAVDLDQPL